MQARLSTTRASTQRLLGRGAQLRSSAPLRPRTTAAAAALPPGLTADDPHIQLATAKLPAAADERAFTAALYQHVSTLTQNGRNLPLVLALRVDRLACGGFRAALLRRDGARGAFDAAVEIVGAVEDVEGVGRVLFVRMFEGPHAFAGRAYSGKPEERLEAVIQSHPDVDTIMGTMAPAIRLAAAVAMGRA